MQPFEKALVETLSYSFDNDTETVTEEPHINRRKLSDAYYKLISIDPENSDEFIYDHTDDDNFIYVGDLPEYLADQNIAGYIKYFPDSNYRIQDHNWDYDFVINAIGYFIDESGTDYMFFDISRNDLSTGKDDKTKYVIVVNIKTLRYDMRIDAAHILKHNPDKFDYTNEDMYSTEYNFTGSSVLDKYIKKLVASFKKS